ncbi:hypothetical protein IDJ75_01775 [Mucilaginibacter rigui]|uniref:Uncharacterized protein n=1 Tax=Mucilaginibacter rigui TaxID=534635 RepID=A0ABR7X084_9SPHI|nr:hypothetical protein [Mucilaginibacter rigui]MBD1383989.1 hypothetical protein [Mucilaginibacter rigui]
MKKILSLLLIILVKTAFCQTEQLKSRSPRETIGETYFVFAAPNAKIYGSLTDEKDEFIKVNDHKNLKLKLMKIDETNGTQIAHFIDSAGNKYNRGLFEGCFPYMVPQKDFEEARKIYSGKTVWINPSIVPATAGDARIEETKVERFKKYTVTTVSLYKNNDEPIKLTLTPESGPALTIAASLTGTNVSYMEKAWLLPKLLFLQDPKTLYNFTPQTWANIKKDYLVPGMDKDAVRLILGNPESINNSSNTGKYATDQWVYPYEYVYFEGGKYKSRNSKN